jgi:hypothetical protein
MLLEPKHVPHIHGMITPPNANDNANANASRSSTLIRKRFFQPLPHFLRQIRTVIIYIGLVSFARQFFEFLRQRLTFFAATIDIDKEHDGEREAH